MDDRVAIVTGGGSGIGRGTALVFAEHGADVVLAGRRRTALEETAALVEAIGRRALVMPTDVTDAQSCNALVSATVAALGRIDALVNSAGGGVSMPLMEWPDDEWRRIVDLNISGTWLPSRAAAAVMLEQGKGSIVNVSSGASFSAYPNGAPYAAAKAAVNNLTGAMSSAWAQHGVRVNAVAPGAVRTEPLIADARQYGLEVDAFGAGTGMRRIAEPDEIGYAILFFASDASSYCSGQTLWVGGGPRSPAN